MQAIRADRLMLEPQVAAHAEEMFRVLSDPAIYEHENEPPATVQPGRRASIAYELSSTVWGRGLASEAVRAMISELVDRYQVRSLSAVLKRGNQRFLRLLERLGFSPASPESHAEARVEPEELLMCRDMEGTESPRSGLLSASLPGTWQLESRVDVTDAGERRLDPSLGDDPVAILVYDRSGHFAAQFMKRDRFAPVADAPSGAPNNSRAQGGYDAYFGTYTVDDAQGTVTQHLVGALSQENVGHVLTRAMTVDGDTLTIRLRTTSTQGEPITRTLTWKRVG